MFTLLLGLSGPMWWVYEVGYLSQAPDKYVCSYASEKDMPECTKENICSSNPAIVSWEADPDDPKTLNNWQK